MKTAGRGAASRFFLQTWNLDVLPVSPSVAATAAVKSTTPTVRSAATLESASTTMEPSASVEPTARTAVEPATAMKATITASEAAAVKPAAPETIATAETASATIEAAPPKVAIAETTTVETTSIEAMEPRAGANKEAIHKVVRTVVAVRRASIRVIPVVAVGAHRSRPVIARTNSNADNHSLRVRRSCRRQRENRH